MSFPRYESYRDSGVEWLGEVPSHWTMSRLGFEAWVRARLGWKGLKAEEYVDEGYAMLSTPDIKRAEIDFNGANRITQARFDESPEIKLRKGDVLLAKDGSTLGTINLVRELVRPSTVNSSLAVITPGERLLDLFLLYYFQSAFIAARIEEQKGGMGVPHLFQDDLVRFPMPLPPLHEQEAIGLFLDRETAKIDALVDEQQRLIELLKEKCQAAISHAVTKGLDPTVPIRDSGVDWLGELPAHWTVRKIKFLTRSVEQGWSPQCENRPVANEGEWGVLKVGCVNGGTFNPLENKALPPELTAAPELGLSRDDILISRANTRELVGSVAVVKTDYPRLMLCDKLYRIRVHEDVCKPDFLALALGTKEARHEIELEASGASSSMLNIAQSTIMSLQVPVPPMEEQNAILAGLGDRATVFGSLIEAAETAINTLQERRAALISAAVTGKIDVRGWSAAEVRKAVSAEIVFLQAHNRTFGRVKNQKALYLAEAHAGIHEIGGRYIRNAAGPYDGDLMALVERELARDAIITVSQPEGPGSTVSYAVARGWKPDRARMAEMLGDRLAKFEHVNAKLVDLDTRGAEAVATLYAVWNDALLNGEVCDDARIIRGFLDEWHPEKRQKFKESELHTWLAWMRRNDFVPLGSGPKTETGRLFI